MEYTAGNNHSERKAAYVRALEAACEANAYAMLRRWLYAAAVGFILYPDDWHFPPENNRLYGMTYEERMSSRLHSLAGLAVFFGLVDEVRMQ